MSVTLHFSPPTVYNVDMWIVGETATATGSLTQVASGTDVGTYPEWINSVVYASGDSTKYYAVRFKTDDDYYTTWSDTMYGTEGAGLGYFILRPSGSKIIYLIPPPVSGTTQCKTNGWSYNRWYTR
jgi:hypothetical protein